MEKNRESTPRTLGKHPCYFPLEAPRGLWIQEPEMERVLDHCWGLRMNASSTLRRSGKPLGIHGSFGWRTVLIREAALKNHNFGTRRVDEANLKLEEKSVEQDGKRDQARCMNMRALNKAVKTDI